VKLLHFSIAKSFNSRSSLFKILSFNPGICRHSQRQRNHDPVSSCRSKSADDAKEEPLHSLYIPGQAEIELKTTFLSISQRVQ
jgi:hypothetical protein